MGLLDQVSDTYAVKQEEAEHPVVVAMRKISIPDLYFFLFKLAAASFLLWAPILILLFVVYYALSH